VPKRTAHGVCLLPWCLLLGCLLLVPGGASAAGLLKGEFEGITLGRTMIEPGRFPTVNEFRAAIRQPQIKPVVMFKLFGSGDNHHLPTFSSDGQRLAFQRSDVQARTSKLLLFAALSDAAPTLLSDAEGAYDYMFRWGVGAPASFVFVRLDADKAHSQVYFCPGGARREKKTAGQARYQHPALYCRTDGIWRMVYEQEGQVMHEAWNDEGPVGRPVLLAPGTSPRWSSDGHRLILARRRSARDPVPVYDMVVWNLRTEKEILLPSGEEGIVRSPTWSPDEQSVAFYVGASGEGRPRRIRVAPASEGAAGKTLGNDVVVNPDFDSEGPAWEPSGRRIWFFSKEHQQGAYYPLVAADVKSGGLSVVDYPNRCTTPSDLAINTANPVPEMVFVAHDGLPKDVFVVFLNHY